MSPLCARKYVKSSRFPKKNPIPDYSTRFWNTLPIKTHPEGLNLLFDISLCKIAHKSMHLDQSAILYWHIQPQTPQYPRWSKHLHNKQSNHSSLHKQKYEGWSILTMGHPCLIQQITCASSASPHGTYQRSNKNQKLQISWAREKEKN